MKPSVIKINSGMEDEMIVKGYRWSKVRFLLMILGVFMSAGLLLILLSWKKSIQLRLSHYRCPLKEAEKVWLKDNDGQEFVEKVDVLSIQYHDKIRYKNYFTNKKINYVWSNRLSQFVKVSGTNQMKTFASFYDNSMGLEKSVADARLQFYGRNSIEIEMKSIPYLIWNEAINPFYVFQALTLILWMVQQYFLFTICVFLLSATSIGVTVWETRKQSRVLKEAVASHSIVTVIRDDEEIQMSSHDLVPGDAIVLSGSNFCLECDAILVSGQCILNESALTGESVPVTKTSLPYKTDEILNFEEHKRHILFCGTELLQARCIGEGKVKAVVLRTGFSTMKGELVRSILYPKPLEFKFYTDFIKFFAIFVALGLLAAVYTSVIWVLIGATTLEIVVYTLDIITFVIPPILPAAYTSITAISQRRLKKHDIYCLSSKYINMCAGLNVVCFDKTGTLTEESLDLVAIIPTDNGRFVEPITDLTNLYLSPLLFTMATCHNLSIIDNQISGYPLDKLIFEFINWGLEDFYDETNLIEDFCTPVAVYPPKQQLTENTDFKKLVVLKQYPFESRFQSMSVIARSFNSYNYWVFCKGAPEKIASLSSSKTVPPSFKSVLNAYTKEGNRVIACAWKALPPSYDWNTMKDLSRDEVECDLEFLGLIILQNLLKPETTDALFGLHSAGIRSVMVTGDNSSTALCVARQCDMIGEADQVIFVKAEVDSKLNRSLCINFESVEGSTISKFHLIHNNQEDACIELLSKPKHHFALEGPAFNLLRLYNRELLQKIILQGTVFARMLPDQKVHLVTFLQELGYQVGMCGDGANDCGALKTAHAGISLSVAEASVAAPFTSKKQNISCILSLIREGRASLVSCMGIFKYQVAYCFALLFATLILYYHALKLSDPQFLYVDLFLSIVPAIAFGNSDAYSEIVKQQPVKKLLGIVPLVSIFTFLLVHLSMYIISLEFTRSQSWFTEYIYVPGKFILPPNYESSSMFCTCIFSILTAAIIFSEGPPYRQPIYTNKILIAFLIIMFIFSTYLSIYPADWLCSWLTMKTAPEIEFHVFHIGIIAGHCLLCYVLEEYGVKYFVTQNLAPYLRQKFGSLTSYQQLSLALENDKSWPPLDQTFQFDAPVLCSVTTSNYNPKRDRRDIDVVDSAIRGRDYLPIDSNMSLESYTCRHFFDPILCWNASLH